MQCCQTCFEDPIIRSEIKKNGKIISQCDFCREENVKGIEPDRLQEYFFPIVDLYPFSESVDGRKIWAQFQNDWEVFSHKVSPELVLSNILRNSGLWRDIVDKTVSSLHPLLKEISDRIDTLWENFSHEIKKLNRFFYDERNLGEITNSLQYLEVELPPKKVFYRARASDQEKGFETHEMGAPPPGRTKNGRANPVGIPYLYLASDSKTAIAEIRPSLGDAVSVGKFETLEPLRVINLVNISPFNFSLSDDIEKSLSYIFFLKRLGEELAKPISPSRSDVEYIPTQFLCEMIKNRKWSGILFKSSQGERENLVIFNSEKCNCKSVTQYEIEEIEYTSNPL